MLYSSNRRGCLILRLLAVLRRRITVAAMRLLGVRRLLAERRRLLTVRMRLVARRMMKCSGVCWRAASSRLERMVLRLL